MRSVLAKIVVGSVLMLPAFSSACICVYSKGEWAAVSREVSVLLWDEKTHTEHFIRSIKFENKGADFGFLIPTQTVPEIKEASTDIFDTFGTLDWEAGTEMKSGQDSVASLPAGAVVVLAEQRAAGLIATTLKADGGASLKQWMDENGYATTPYTSQWAQPYLDKHWPMTVFKIDPAEYNKNTKPRAMRMSFHTDQLYYPYNGYQPEDTPKAPPRQLKMYLVSNAALRFSDESSEQWTGRLQEFAGRLPNNFRSDVTRLADLPDGSIDGMDKIYRIENAVPASTRTHDLFFKVSKRGEPNGPPTAIILGGTLAAVGIGLWFLKRRG